MPDNGPSDNCTCVYPPDYDDPFKGCAVHGAKRSGGPDWNGIMAELEATIDHIVGVDLPGLSPRERITLVGHLTGAVIVTVMQGVGDAR